MKTCGHKFVSSQNTKRRMLRNSVTDMTASDLKWSILSFARNVVVIVFVSLVFLLILLLLHIVIWCWRRMIACWILAIDVVVLLLYVLLYLTFFVRITGYLESFV